MKINIFGSTGIIGSKTLQIISQYFPNIKINLLVANNNNNKLMSQAIKYKPKYLYLANEVKNDKLKLKLKDYKIKILNTYQLKEYLNTSKSDLTLLSISGYNSLIYFEDIIKNSKNIGLVSKECIVSGGHLFKKIIKKNKIKLFPLDSEHFSLFDYFENNIKKKFYKKIILTASGGPFLKFLPSSFGKITFNQAIDHPKWKMGYKNSIDSATMANKCLELVEAKYLFDIPFDKLDVLIHPESLVHSIVELDNHMSYLNYFYNDMSIPITNFLNFFSKTNTFHTNKNFEIKKNFKLTFQSVDIKQFPIYQTFIMLNKDKPENLIKFNCANEYAVELFKLQAIKFNEINTIINKCLLINIDYPVNNIKNIIRYQKICLDKFNEIKNI